GIEVVDEEALAHPDLGGGQAEARGLVHGVEHVVGELDQLAVDVGDLGGGGAQHRIADDSDVVGRAHDGPNATVAAVGAPPDQPSTEPTSGGAEGHYFAAAPT